MLEGGPSIYNIDDQRRNEIIRITKIFIKYNIPKKQDRIKALEKIDNEEFVLEALKPFKEILSQGDNIEDEEIARNLFDLINMVIKRDVGAEDKTFAPPKKPWTKYDQ